MSGKILSIIVFLALGFAVFSLFGSNDKEKIKTLIEEITTEASAGSEINGIQIQTKAMTVTRFLTPKFNAKLVMRDGRIHTTPSKQELVSDLTAAIYVMRPLIVEVSGLDVTVLPGGESAEATLDINLRHSQLEQPFESARFLLEVKKIDGEWLLERAEGEVVTP